jgi:rhamnosyltransferase subunit B
MPSRLDPPHPPRPLPSWAHLLARRPLGSRLLWKLRATRNAIASKWARTGAEHAARIRKGILDEYDRVRARHGLPPAGPDSVRSPIAVLGLWPEWFAPPQRDWPALAVATGFPIDPIDPGPGAVRPSAGVEDSRRPVVFTTGSLAGGQKTFYAAAAEACRRLDRPGILVTPHLEDLPAVLPGSVTCMAATPFAELFAEASAVVHHGGIGTTALALAAGIPQVARPFVGEQFDIANRMRRLGVGVTIDDDDLVPDRLAGTIDRLLRSERVRERCRRVQARLRTLGGGGLNRAADVIEEAGARACPRMFESRRAAS